MRSSTRLLSKLKADKNADTSDAMLGMVPLSWEGKEKENLPVIKVEDSERLYRPLFKQFEGFPKVAYNETGSPFDVGVVLVKQSDNQSIKRKSVGGALKGGYCESCDHWYRCSLKEHLSSNKHKEFVGKLDNFKNLEHVSENVPSFNNFLAQYQKSSQINLSEDRFSGASDLNNNEAVEAAKCSSETNVDENIAERNHSSLVTGNPTKYFMQKYESKQVAETSSELMNNNGNSGTETLIDQNKKAVPAGASEYSIHKTTNKLIGNDDYGLTNSLKGIQTVSSYDKNRQQHEIKRQILSYQKSSDMTDFSRYSGADVAVPEAADASHVIPEANFSSSSCSFGDNGVRNALTILQNTMSENSLGRESADIFTNNSNETNVSKTTESQRSNSLSVVSKSEISLESKVSFLNSGSMLAPNLKNFLKEKANDDAYDDMPVLFPVEQLSLADIENGLMPLIEGHSPPDIVKIDTAKTVSHSSSTTTENYAASSQNSKKSDSEVTPVDKLYVGSSKEQSSKAVDFVSHASSTTTTENYAASSQNSKKAESEVTPLDKLYVGSTKEHSSKAVDFDKQDTKNNVPKSFQTPTRELENNMCKKIHEKVTHSGSTITSVKNWLLPNEDKGSVCSDLSIFKLNNTLVAHTDNDDTETRGKENITGNEDHPRDLVANWIKSQEFSSYSENQLSLYDPELKDLADNKSPKINPKSEEIINSRNIQTPISELNNELTDLSSIPTDSIGSEDGYTSSQMTNPSRHNGHSNDDMKADLKSVSEKDSAVEEPSIFRYELGNHKHEELKSKNDTKPLNSESTNPVSTHTLVSTHTSKTVVSELNFENKPEVKRFSSVGLNVTVHQDAKTDNSVVESKPLCTTVQMELSNPVVCADSCSREQNEVNKLFEKKCPPHIESKAEKTKGKRSKVEKTQAKPTTKKSKSKTEKSLLKSCLTPVSRSAFNSPGTYQNCVTGNLDSTPYGQQQLYSPISQSSDHFIEQQNGFHPYKIQGYQAGGIQNQVQMPMAPENEWNQQYCQPADYQYQNTQAQSYYNTGILPGQNFYSEERLNYQQNISGMQSHQYGFSGLSDCSFTNYSPQQYPNNIYGYPQNSFGNVHTTTGSPNAVPYSQSEQNCIQHPMDLSQIDFLDNNCSVSQAVRYCGSSASPVSTYAVQNPPFSVPIHQFPQLKTSGHFSSIQDSQQVLNSYPQFSQNYCFQEKVSQEPVLTFQTNQGCMSSPGCVQQNNNDMPVSHPKILETISLNDIAEDSCNTVNMAFPLGKFKSNANQEPVNVIRNSITEPNLLKTPGISHTKSSNKCYKSSLSPSCATDNKVNKANGYLQASVTVNTGHSLTAAVNGHNIETMINSSLNTLTPSVQPLKASVYLAETTSCENSNRCENAFNRTDKQMPNNDRSYVSAKVGDTKLKISKLGPLKDEKRPDLMDFWNVKKTGDCRLVFRASKRKAEDESSSNESGYVTLSTENCRWEQDNILPHAKKRRCLVY